MVLTVSEIAKLLRVSKTTVNKEIYDGKLKAFKVRGRYRVEEEDFTKYKEKEIKKEED